MSVCDHECKNEERVRLVEQGLIRIETETGVYIRQLSDNFNDIKLVINSLKNKQLNEAEIKEIVRSTVQSIDESKGEESKIYVITIEVLKMLGTALAIIGGMQIVG